MYLARCIERSADPASSMPDSAPHRPQASRAAPSARARPLLLPATAGGTRAGARGSLNAPPRGMSLVLVATLVPVHAGPVGTSRGYAGVAPPAAASVVTVLAVLPLESAGQRAAELAVAEPNGDATRDVMRCRFSAPSGPPDVGDGGSTLGSGVVVRTDGRP